MEVLLPQPRGFCAGVQMAVECLDRVIARYGAPVFAYHQIVHNRHVVASFERRGVRFVDDVTQVPRGAVVVFSAHGVSPEVRAAAEQRCLKVIDATCPLVTKVHTEARRFAGEGYVVAFIGHRGHDETQGVLGEAADRIVVLESVADAESLVLAPQQRLAYLTQTTFSVSETAAIVAALLRRFPHARGPSKSDICYATENRQGAVRQWSRDCDLALVIGSDNSSNTRRLVETGQASGIPAHRIDGAGDIDPRWLRGVDRVLVTAGASVPESLVDEVVGWFADRHPDCVVSRVGETEDVTFRLPVEVRDSVPRQVRSPQLRPEAEAMAPPSGGHGLL